MARRGIDGHSVRTWTRSLAPLVAWIALAVAVSDRPGWAAGDERVEAADRGVETGAGRGTAAPSDGRAERSADGKPSDL
ncbi:hypothetical protein K2X89_17645, partial [Myxococcota bacterium]|nr:hypothetical protein [Myxococcota bacterium]